MRCDVYRSFFFPFALTGAVYVWVWVGVWVWMGTSLLQP